jgi:hypothetical protein
VNPPLPLHGETALITAGGLVAGGHLSLPRVIAVAAGAAISGDTMGYWLGRGGGAPRRRRPRARSRHDRRRPVGRRLRAADPRRAIVMLSARTDVEDREEALAAGADAYFIKPFALGELLDHIGALAGAGRSRSR